MKNTHYYPFINDKNEEPESKGQNLNESAEIDEETATIAYFRIHPDFTIDRFYDTNFEPTSMNLDNDKQSSTMDEKQFKWSFDLSNMQSINTGISFLSPYHT